MRYWPVAHSYTCLWFGCFSDLPARLGHTAARFGRQ